MSGVLAALVLVLLVGLTQVTPQTMNATTVVARGTALVLRNENSSFRTFYDGDILKVNKGDRIITAPKVPLHFNAL